MRVGIVGLGRLGLPVATAMAARGLEVYGYDPHVRDWPEDPSYEEGFAEAIEQAKGRFHFCAGIEEVVQNAATIFCAVQTPHEPRFEGVTPLPEDRADFDYCFLREAARQINSAAERCNRFITLSVISTVLPGTMRTHIRPLLHSRVSLVYNPSFIAMGTTIQDFLDPEFVLLGGDSDGKAAAVYERVLHPEAIYEEARTRFYSTSIENAELIKVAYNTFIGLKLAFANTLMEVCHKTPGTDVDEVTGALSLAHRRLISPAYMTGGMGDGGGCFPPGELIITETGPRPIESVEPGDRVLAGDGVLRPVMRRWERHYEGDLMRVSVEGMPDTLATADHPFYVASDLRPPGAGRKHHPSGGKLRDNLGTLIDVPAEEVSVGDDFAAWPHALEDLTVKVPDHATPEYLELAGWYLSEGSIYKRRANTGKARSARISFDLHANEVAERERIQELVKVVAPSPESGRGSDAKVATVVKDNKATVRFGSLPLSLQLEDDFGCGCADKTIPPWVLWGPLENAKTLLQGLIMGDGHIAPTGIHFATTSRDMAYGVLILWQRLGVPASLRTADRKNRLRQYEVRTRNGPDAVKLAELLGIPTPASPRKGAERYPDRADGHLYRRVRNVERIPYSGSVYNLWVDEEHSYVTNAGRVANCHPRDNIALSWLARELDLSYDIFEATMLQRERQAEWLADLMCEYDLPKGILGIAYKPGSHITTGSPALLVGEMLKRRGADGREVRLIDPYVYEHDRDAVIPPDRRVWLVGCNHPDWPIDLPAGSVVIDPWRTWPDQEGVEVIRIGSGSRTPFAMLRHEQTQEHQAAA